MNLLRLGPLAVGLSSVLMVLACGGGDEGVKTAKDTLPGQRDMAMKEYDRAGRLAPNKAIAYYARGGAYGRLGQYQRAIQDFDESIRVDPNLALVFKNRGLAYSILGQYHQAIQDYDHAIKLNPDYAYAYCNRGMAYMDLRQLERAIQDCDQGIKLRRRPGHRFEIGLCRSLLQGQLSKAHVDED